MSRLEGKKGLSCIINCLPMKSRRNKALMAQNKLKAPGNLASGGRPVESTMTLNDTYINDEEDKLAHTKQWLQNLSTVANYEPTSILEDPEASQLDDPDDRPSRSRCPDGCCKCDDNDCSSASCRSKSRGRPGCNESALSDVKPNLDESSILSSKLCDSSVLSSKCCSQHRRRRRKQGYQNHETSSMISDFSSVSLPTELVTLNLDECKHLGITIVGHSNSQGDCGIFVGSINKSGAAARDGRIQPGDLILEVNGVDLERMTNEHAAVTMKTELAKGGIIQILVAKYWDACPNDDSENTFHDGDVYEQCGSVKSVPLSRAGSKQAYGCPRPSHSNRASFQPPVNDGLMRDFYQAAGTSYCEIDKIKGRAAQMTAAMPPPTALPPVYGSKVFSSSSSVHTGYPDSGFSDTRPVGYGVASAGPGPFSLPLQGSTLDRRLHSAAMAHGTSSDHGLSGRPFLGSDLINWIRGQASNTLDRQEAYNYAQNLLMSGYICNADFRQGMQFQEANYYAFGQNSGHSLNRAL